MLLTFQSALLGSIILFLPFFLQLMNQTFVYNKFPIKLIGSHESRKHTHIYTFILLQFQSISMEIYFIIIHSEDYLFGCTTSMNAV